MLQGSATAAEVHSVFAKHLFQMPEVSASSVGSLNEESFTLNFWCPATRKDLDLPFFFLYISAFPRAAELINDFSWFIAVLIFWESLQIF